MLRGLEVTTGLRARPGRGGSRIGSGASSAKRSLPKSTDVAAQIDQQEEGGGAGDEEQDRHHAGDGVWAARRSASGDELKEQAAGYDHCRPDKEHDPPNLEYARIPGLCPRCLRDGQGRRWCFPGCRGRRETASGWIDPIVAVPVERNCSLIMSPRITAVCRRLRLLKVFSDRLELIRG